MIKSREFYKLFLSIKEKLSRQKTSHRTAGEFLHTLKILMAKLKVRLILTYCIGTDQCCMRRQTIGELCLVCSRFLVVTLLNVRVRNYGLTPREFSPRDLARCLGDRVFQSRSRA